MGRLDVASIESIQEFKLAFGDTRLNVLLNVAGMSNNLFYTSVSYPLAGVMPNKASDTLNGLTVDMVNTAFTINTFGPFFLTQALMPNIISASGPRHIAVVSSRVGSITDNTSGGLYAYRASKTAVNSFFKTMSVELKDRNIVVSMLHPGFTKTGLDADVWNMKEAVGPEEAATKLWNVVKSKQIEDTGKFWHREGNELPW